MPHLHKYLVLFLCFLLGLSTFGQNRRMQQSIDFPRQMIQQLTSSQMHGRGYVNKGDSIAASFIARSFQQNKVKPFKKSFFQEYELDVNTFPGRMMLVVDGDTLEAGREYLVLPQSNGGEDSLTVVTINANDIKDGQRFGEKYRKIQEGKAQMIYLNALGFQDADSLKLLRGLVSELSQTCPVITTQNKKLTWAVGRDTTQFPVFQIIDSIAPKEITWIKYAVDQHFLSRYKTENVLGFIEGKDPKLKKEYLVFTAHYDHLGRMGQEVFFPGANDNASGTSMLLALARFYSKKPPKRTVVFIAFSGEEAGLEGSSYFVEHPLFKLNKIRFVLNLDIFGSGDDGITVVNAKKHEEEFALLNEVNSELNAVPQIKARSESYNSDHYPFTLKNVPAWFIYTMGKAKQYHDPDDVLSTLSLDYFIPLRNLLIQFERELE